MKDYKLIATDIDGTLFDNNHNFDKEKLNSLIEKLHRRNIKFVVASGNTYNHLERLFKEVTGIDAIMVENGGQLVIADTTVYERVFSNQEAQKLIEILIKNSSINNIYVSGKKATYTTDKSNLEGNFYYDNLKYIANYVDIQDEIFKINILLNNEMLDETVNDLNKINSKMLYAAVSGHGSIDIVPQNTNKGIALKELASHFNISTEQMMAFGDNKNDLEMIQVAGLGIAMRNAVPLIKEKANAITQYDNDNEGVLKEIKTIFNI